MLRTFAEGTQSNLLEVTVKRGLSLAVGALALMWLSVPPTSSGRPLEGGPESFLGEPRFEVQQISQSKERGIQANGVMALDGTVLVTWPVSRLICAGHSAYSCLTVLPDKSIGLLYDRDHHATVTFARFTLDWLSRGKDQEGVAD